MSLPILCSSHVFSLNSKNHESPLQLGTTICFQELRQIAPQKNAFISVYMCLQVNMKWSELDLESVSCCGLSPGCKGSYFSQEGWPRLRVLQMQMATVYSNRTKLITHALRCPEDLRKNQALPFLQSLTSSRNKNIQHLTGHWSNKL